MGNRRREVASVLCAGIAAICLLLANGCGGGSSANVISVSIFSSSGTNLILGQSTTLTATVTGATNTNVNWTPVCQYTTTSTDSTGKTTTSKPANCPPDPTVMPQDPNHTVFGVFSNQQATGTEVFTAPNSLPDAKTYPGLVIIATAQSQQDTKRTGTINLILNSGIGISFTPGTASLPTGEQQTFLASLTNDIGNTKGVTWSLTQQVPTSTTGSTPNPYTPLATCSPTCGTLMDPKANPVTYMAPPMVPTAITPAQTNNTNSPANVTLVAVSNGDPTRFTIGTITIIPSGPITFRGISPTIAPQGAALWDIYLDAPNISSASKITLTYPGGGSVTKTSNMGQIKVLFPVPASSSSSSSSSTTTCTSTSPCSTGARLRLNAGDLSPTGCVNGQPCSVTVSVTDPNPNVTITQCTGTPLPTGCTSAGVFTYNIIPVRPTSTATIPDDIVQGSATQGSPITVNIDGGYFGPFNPSVYPNSATNLVRAFFQSPGNALSVNTTNSDSRHLIATLSGTNPSNPGLYPLYVAQATNATAASPNNPSVTNMAIFPDYSGTVTTPIGHTTVPITGANPSAVDIDPDLGVLVVAETGSNTVEFFSIGSGTITSFGQVSTTTAAPINVPTGVSVDRLHHTVAVVNFGTQAPATSTAPCQPMGQSVTVLNIPGNPNPITPFHVDLPFNTTVGSATFQASVCPAPMPYSVGVDSDSQLALVAYSSTTVSSVDNLGFIVNLNPNSGTNSYGCPLTDAITGQTPASGPVGQCLYAQVTLNTGTYPQIAVAPHGHSALVTPGGSGAVRGVDVTRQSSANIIVSSSLTAGIVTVTVSTKCPPGVTQTSGDSNNPCPLLMVPGAAGTVLIAGLVPKNNMANNAFFNGVFTVNVTSSNSFTYVVPNTTVTDTAGPGTNPPTTPTVYYGSPDQIFGLPATTQGVAINPITSTAAIADANATGTNGPQIDLLNGLDQSVSSISFFATCTAFSTTCSNSPELLATTSVAWQPYTNEVVSYNAKQGFVSVADPVGHKRYAIVPDPSSGNHLGPSAMAFPVMNGTSNPTLTLWGGVAVDPATDQAFVVESGQAACSSCTPPISPTPGQIEIISLKGSAPVKATHISEIVVPSPVGAPQGSIGGISNALVAQATLTCTTPTPPATTCDLPGVQVFGSGFNMPAPSTPQVRLDNVSINGFCSAPNPPSCVTVKSDREIDITIPATIPTSNPNNPFKPLSMPHKFALDVINGNGVQSNAVDFIVVQSVPLSNLCTDSTGNPIPNTMPSSVAIADQIANRPLFSPIALVSVTGCNDVVMIDINPTIISLNAPPQPNPNFGQRIGNPIHVGTNPQGIAIWQRKGLAVIANNGSGTASIIDLTQSPPGPAMCAASSGSTGSTAPCADVSTGTNPTGVAINEATGAAIVTNFASNTVTMINLGLLFPQPNASLPTSLTPTSIGGIQEPIAVAIDPDRGSSNQGIAVVSAVQLSNGAAPTGALAVVEIGQATPALSTTISSGFVSSTPTGVVFDPAVATTTTNPGVFFANSSGTNAITEFNPDSGGGTSVNVGINPTSLAINPQTGAMLTANSASNTISIVDTISSPFATRQTLGIPGSPTFGVAIDQFTNLAVIVDQANNRVLLFPMPN